MPLKTKAEKSQKSKSDAMVKKHLKDLLAAENISLEENFKDIQNIDFPQIALEKVITKENKKPSSVKSESKKENPFLNFMKDFRQQNQGKFVGKTMMKEGGKAWRNLKEVKSGGKSIILKETPKHKSQNQFTELHKIT